MTLEASEAFCLAVLPKVSRTFALSISQLPSELRRATCAAYLLCRIVDTIEDDRVISCDTRESLFDAFDRCLLDDAYSVEEFVELSRRARVGEAEPVEHALCVDSEHVWTVFRALAPAAKRAIRGPVSVMSAGMREFSARFDIEGALRIVDEAELERYCFYVAGTVGKLLTELFLLEVPGLDSQTRARLRSSSVHFGIGLQITNIVKDVASDYEGGVCFLPLSLANARGLRLEALLSAEERASGLAVITDLCWRARRHLRHAVEYASLWPAREGAAVRLFCAVPLAFAFGSLDEVERGADTLVPHRTPKISRELVANIMNEAVRVTAARDGLEAFFATYCSPPARSTAA